MTDGTATFVADIRNAPPAPLGETNPKMIMSIAFDKHQVLYGTTIVGFWVTSVTNAPIMRIDTKAGEDTLLGWSTLGYNHGGDTMPTQCGWPIPGGTAPTPAFRSLWLLCRPTSRTTTTRQAPAAMTAIARE